MNVIGRVVTFDDHRGDGVVARDDGERWYFHCVAILDGSRHVEVGALVEGARAVGHLGRDELVALRQV